jgi:hypothetical protein
VDAQNSVEFSQTLARFLYDRSHNTHSVQPVQSLFGVVSQWSTQTKEYCYSHILIHIFSDFTRVLYDGSTKNSPKFSQTLANFYMTGYITPNPYRSLNHALVLFYSTQSKQKNIATRLLRFTFCFLYCFYSD